MVVHELLERNVAYREIKSHIQNLRKRFGVDWPLTQSPIETATVGGTEKVGPRVVTREGERLYDTGRRGWQQQVVGIGDLQRIAEWLHRGGWAARKLEDLNHIEVNPDRLSGRPTIRDRRIAAEDVAEMAARPNGFALLRADYELTDDEINDARRWWAVVREYEQAA
jgi:uncharacterized protein (DUF433 family)